MYALFFPTEGRYSVAMPLREAKILMKHFSEAVLVDARTAIAL